MTSVVAFLPANPDEAPKSLGSYKPQNTDVIRTMLREQQKECQVLHTSPLFKEFRGEGTVKQNKFGKGYAITSDVNAPAFDDCQAEGQSRMFDLIRNTAMKDEKPMKGVWAPFGKAYECLGEPSEPSSSLPKLFRDEMAAERDGKNNAKGNNRKVAKPNRDSGGAATAAATRMAAAQARGTAEARAAAAMEDELMGRNRSTMKYGLVDQLETKFPEAPLKGALERRARSQAMPGAFVDRAGAEADASNPAQAYGQIVLSRHGLQPLKMPDAAAAALRRPNPSEAGPDGGPSFFMTQGPNGTGGGGEDDSLSPGSTIRARRSEAGPGGMRATASATPDLLNSTQASLPAAEGGGPNAPAPTYQAVSERAQAPRGQEENPVYRWHNDFLQVRQDGRKDLQQALWQRSEGRRRARTSGAMAATLSTAIMGDLSLSQGRALGYPISGVQPASPYTKMEANYAAGLEGAKVKAKAASTLEPDELRILQRFYDQLCALVEQQRMSDPISLMVIHKVKSLLEAGVFLHKPMLVAVVEHIMRFTRGCGLVRYNRYLLAILTFVSKCVGCGEAELEEVVADFEMAEVVYGTPVPPSRMTPELLALVQAQQQQQLAAQQLQQQLQIQAAGAEAAAHDRENSPSGKLKSAPKPFGKAMDHPAVIAALASAMDFRRTAPPAAPSAAASPAGGEAGTGASDDPSTQGPPGSASNPHTPSVHASRPGTSSVAGGAPGGASVPHTPSVHGLSRPGTSGTAGAPSVPVTPGVSKLSGSVPVTPGAPGRGGGGAQDLPEAPGEILDSIAELRGASREGGPTRGVTPKEAVSLPSIP